MNRLLALAAAVLTLVGAPVLAQDAGAPLFAGKVDIPLQDGSARSNACGVEEGGPDGGMMECLDIEASRAGSVIAAYGRWFTGQGWTALDRGRFERRSGEDRCDLVSLLALPGPNPNNLLLLMAYSPNRPCQARK